MALSDFNVTQFIFNIPGKTLKVFGFQAVEQISIPYEVVLVLASQEQIAFDDMINKEGLLTIYNDDKNLDRFFHGIIEKFEQSGMHGQYYMYKAILVPKFKLLNLKQNVRIFQNKNAQDIITQVLNEADIASDDFMFSVLKPCEVRTYCVQYRETDFDFISRLLEEEGIYYYFEHLKDKHKIIFQDGAVASSSIIGDPTLPFVYGANLASDKDTISSFTFSKQILPGKSVLRDFNFEKTTLDLTSEQKGDVNQNLEIYDYPGKYLLGAQGSKISKTRFEQNIVFTEKGSGNCNSPRFMPGFTFTLGNHDVRSFEQNYLIVSVSHTGHQPQVLDKDAPGTGFSYNNQFLCIPKTVIMRPIIKTPKPIVQGVQTAIIVGPSGEEIYTDKHGRVKVQFHWDREGEKNEKSSCWIRVSQGGWAGANWGGMHIPRIGHEVIVDFIEGDPDRPIITGKVYHGRNIPPYPLPAQKTMSTIKSRSTPGGGSDNFNEFRFEDKKGEEEIYLHGEKDWTIKIENDKNQTVDHDETMDVGNNRTKSVGVDQKETIGSNKTIEVGTNHTEKIGSNMSLTVGSNQTETIAINSAETIGVAKELTIGGAYQVSVGAAKNQTIGGAKAEEVGLAKFVMVGRGYSEKVGKTHSLQAEKATIEAQESIELKSGAGSLVIDKSGKITIKGTEINIEGTKFDFKATGKVSITGSLIDLNC